MKLRSANRYGYLLLIGALFAGFFGFTSTTSAATVVLTQSATGVQHDRAQLNGLVFPVDDSAIVAWFEWGNSNQTNNTTAQQFLNPGGGDVSFSLSGLRENETYFFRLVARTTSESDATRGSLFSFETSDEGDAIFDFGDPFGNSPPIAFTLNATRVSREAATLNGFVDTEDDTTFWFEWGESPSLGRSTGSVNVDEAYGNISRKVSNLNEGETYYFRAVSRNSNGTSQGGILQFTAEGENYYGSDDDDDDNNDNNGAPTSPFRPRVQTRDAFSLQNGTAVLQGRAENIRGDKATVWFQWGSTTALGNVTLPQNFNVNAFSFSTPIGGLRNGETYFYRAAGENEYGTTLGDVLSFKAGSGNSNGGGGNTGGEFRAFTTEAADVSTNSAIVGALVVPENSGTTAHIAWGPTRDLANTTTSVSTGSIGTANAVTRTLSGLSPNTIYYYQAIATDSSDTVKGSVLSFRTRSNNTNPNPGPAPTPGPITRTSIFITAENIDEPNGTETSLAAGVGDTVEYEVLVRNIGTRNLSNVTIFGKLNPFVEYLSSSHQGLYDDLSRDLRWEFEELATGEEKKIILRTLISDFTESTVAEQSFIMESGDLLRRSNKASVVLSLSPVSFTIAARPSDADAGDRVRYTADIENKGESNLENVELRITFPNGITFLDSEEDFRSAGRTAILSLGGLEVSEERRIIFEGEVKNGVRRGEELPLLGVVSYYDPLLDQRGSITSIATVIIGGSFFGGSASLFGAGFFPTTLIGWLALLLLLILIALLGLKLYELFIVAGRDDEEDEDGQGGGTPPVIIAAATDEKEDEEKDKQEEKKEDPPSFMAMFGKDEDEEEVLRISDLPRE